jgi:hypothetical protein
MLMSSDVRATESYISPNIRDGWEKLITFSTAPGPADGRLSWPLTSK